jgi:dUTP pyrophosphatase
MINIKIARVGNHDLPLPKQETEFSAGFDLRTVNSFDLHTTDRALVSTGFAFEIPEGYCGQIWARSGLASKFGIMSMAGLIDSDYRGEVKALLYNAGQDSITFEKGDRIAQIIFVPYLQATMEEVKSLNKTKRGKGGFGSTGK